MESAGLSYAATQAADFPGKYIRFLAKNGIVLDPNGGIVDAFNPTGPKQRLVLRFALPGIAVGMPASKAATPDYAPTNFKRWGSTLAHEVGHYLGLFHPNDPNFVKRTFSEDVWSVQRLLYHALAFSGAAGTADVGYGNTVPGLLLTHNHVQCGVFATDPDRATFLDPEGGEVETARKAAKAAAGTMVSDRRESPRWRCRLGLAALLAGGGCDVTPRPPSPPPISTPEPPLVCGPGLADCDGVRANGCEAFLFSSDEHCGSCGHACGYHQRCLAERCVPTPVELAWGPQEQSVRPHAGRHRPLLGSQRPPSGGRRARGHHETHTHRRPDGRRSGERGQRAELRRPAIWARPLLGARLRFGVRRGTRSGKRHKRIERASDPAA